MSNEKIDYIYDEVKDMRKDLKAIHSEIIVLKTEKKVSIAFFTVIISTITTFLYRFFDNIK